MRSLSVATPMMEAATAGTVSICISSSEKSVMSVASREGAGNMEEPAAAVLPPPRARVTLTALRALASDGSTLAASAAAT
ncbi:hypothetical protein EON62_03555 [archaeon]|nr:MAG: hypothetical protein EON62_03555 [archaeon]